MLPPLGSRRRHAPLGSRAPRALGAALCAALGASCSLVSLDNLSSGGEGGGTSTAQTGSQTSASTSEGVSAASSGGGGAGPTASASTSIAASSALSAGGGGAGGGAGGDGPTSAYRDAVLASEPVVYLRLGEDELESTARDETGNHDGTYQPGATRGLPGALAGDPSTAVAPSTDIAPLGAVVLGDVLDFSEDAASAFTIELWIRVREAPGKMDDFQVLLAKDSFGPERVGYLLGLFPQDQFWALGFERFAVGPDMNARYPFEVPIEPGGWHHVVASHAPASSVLYLDGEAISSGVGSAEPLGDTTAPLVIGANSQTNYAFSGEIDEVAIYDRALLPSEVREHFEVAKAGP